MTKIESVNACTVRVPLNVPTAFSTRRVLARDYALVRVRGDDGVEGIGFCYGGNNAGGLVTKAVLDLFAPLLVGQDAHAVERHWEVMYREGLLQGRAGAVMRALSILDIAMWDRNARAANLPLYKFLGAHRTETVPAYASGGYYLEGKTPAMLGEEMARYVAMGFKAVKMKVGGHGEQLEEDRIRAAREAIGPDVLLTLDANNAWNDLPTALRFVRRYEPYDPYWVEEPFSPDDIDNHARLAAATSINVATGEIEVGRWRFKHLLESGGAAILQTDAAVCGGISEWRRIAATAASFGVNMCPHWFHDLHIHLVASVPNGEMVEFFPDSEVLNFRRLVDTQLEIQNGELVLPQTPGMGFDFDEEVVSSFAMDPWQRVGLGNSFKAGA
ncbi:L-alanine-DL-glutamate epimerase-like enolase superfamily enzyme [Rhodoligotrophos appendicifer]|uniref:mandelate racemase/muconate lactonizing enzyme family protein n=1 Tax=Rhodoligotrophos appendicifer TaxID=987056 RepID=UPI0011866907|nr:mandelate racemase/muconate lactonizing enzyme family protein [Rhodoligotrophos appendicifer]